MPTLIPGPTRIEAEGNKPIRIDEYIGRINSGHRQVSIALLKRPGGWIEPGQVPEFEEFTIVLKGEPVTDEEKEPRRDWSDAEVALVVADYFAMLRKDLLGEPYSKTDHRSALREHLAEPLPGESFETLSA